MLPVLILIVPPSVLGGGYACWHVGQQAATSITKGTEYDMLHISNINHSTGSYMAGIGSMLGIYGIISSQFVRLEDTNTNTSTKTSINNTKTKTSTHHIHIPPHKQTKAHQFQPPKTIQEAFQRMGRPVLIRAGAGSIAFFCGGLVQMLVSSASASADVA